MARPGPRNKSQPPRVVDIGSFGLRAWRGKPGNMASAHVHTDVEWNFVLSGSMTYLLGGAVKTLPAKTLGLFWAGMPHRLIETPVDTELFWVTIPLAWVLQWDIGEVFVSRLLSGELLQDASRTANPDIDVLLLSQWVNDLEKGGATQRRVVMIEIEGRLRRLAVHLSRRSADTGVGPDASSLSQVDRLVQWVGQHYRDVKSVAQVAGAVDLHPNYAMNLFKRGCGISLWEYITRLRVSHAQRLLLTTDWKITRIALEAGFASQGRFYESFERIVEKTPREYRMAMAQK